MTVGAGRAAAYNGAVQLALGPRLEAVAALVLPGEPSLDVGTDHGSLPAALVVRGRVPRAVASDLRPAPLAVAAATIARLRVGDRVALRCADGLRAIDPGEVATITITGMGPDTVVAILAAEPERRLRARRLVLQPNYAPVRVRRWLFAHGYTLVDERLVEERGRFYAVLAAEAGAAPACSEAALEFGPILLERGGPTLVRYLRRALDLAATEREGLRRATAPDPARVAAAEARYALVADTLAKRTGMPHPGRP